MNSSQFSPHNLSLSSTENNSDMPVGTKQPSPREFFLVRAFAKLVSYIFHPLFIPAYVMAFLLYVHPHAFTGFDEKKKMLRLLSVLVSTVLLPAFSVFLLWRLQLFTSSIYLRTQKERIIPYVISMVFYFWIWYVFNNLPDSPPVVKEFLLGAFLAICGSWMANIWFKISMHGTAIGGLMMFFLLQSLKEQYFGGLYLTIALLITGLVCSARLILGGHTRGEVYAGLFVGALSQLIALYFT